MSHLASVTVLGQEEDGHSFPEVYGSPVLGQDKLDFRICSQTNH